MGKELFELNQSQLPKSDRQIVRVDMEEEQIGGRKSHLPGQNKSDVLSVSHVPNAGTYR